MRLIRHGLSITLAFFSTVGAAASVCEIIEKQNIKTLPLDNIMTYVESFAFPQSGAPALMIGIISGNEKAVLSCGESVIGNKTKPQLNSIWAIGSVSKVFTTQILAEMVNKGFVTLNTTLDALIGNTSSHDTPITLLDLATHSSGFPRMLPTIETTADYQINVPYGMEDFLKWYQTAKLPLKPGTHYEYSNIGFGILGQVLAKKMHTDYAGLLDTMISKPLGLKDTTITLSKEQENRKVASYWMNGDRIKKDWNMAFEMPSGGIYSSMEDLLKFTQYQLGKTPDSRHNTQIAHASYIYQYQLDNPYGLGSDAMALGWSVYFPSHGIPLRLEKNGWVNGVNAYVQVYPTHDIGMISLTSKPYLNIHADLTTIVGMMVAGRSAK